MSVRIAVNLFFLFALFPAAIQAEVRTWTDVRGNKIEAEFVRLAGERVELRRDGKKAFFPLSAFSAADQAYVRTQTANADKEKTKSNTDPAPANGGFRTWKVRFGSEVKEIEARFEKVEKGRIWLKQVAGTTTTDFSNLSTEDQQYLRELLATRGQSHLLPRVPVNNTPANDSPVNNRTDDDKPAGDSPDDGDYRVWKVRHGGGRRDMRARLQSVQNARVLLRGADGSSTSTPFAELVPEDQQYIRDYLAARGQSHLIPKESVSANKSPEARASASNSASSSPEQQEGRCGSCNKVVPASVRAGDRCPHCGVFFQYEETADGSKKHYSHQLKIPSNKKNAVWEHIESERERQANSSNGSNRGLTRLIVRGGIVLVMILMAIGGVIAKQLMGK